MVASTKTPRPRGRPRKNPAAQPAEAKVSKSRGRPRKNPVFEPAEAKVARPRGRPRKSPSAEPAETKTPRPRGRPPKNPEVTPAPRPSKQRGRPQKNPDAKMTPLKTAGSRSKTATGSRTKAASASKDPVVGRTKASASLFKPNKRKPKTTALPAISRASSSDSNASSITVSAGSISGTRSKSTISFLRDREDASNDANDSTRAKWLTKALRRGLPSPKATTKSWRNALERGNFAEKHRWWTFGDWARVIWSGKLTIILPGTGIYKSWVMKDTPIENIPSPIPPESLTVWACMTYDGLGYICKLDDDMDQALYVDILKDELQRTISYYDIDPKEALLQQNNMPVNHTKAVTEWIDSQPYGVLEWPLGSADLNPLWGVWSLIRHEIHYDYPTPKTVSEMWDKVQDLWRDVDVHICRDIIDRMPAHLEKIRQA
ncbi:hypothetical protein COEREDRAFT_81612 [Coemansia reversa NRRL 1564]|uniref:Tc1-like transposase DDE domain-containing protein n=1 Tax=Coemansia reversa (strain ATCC 12441 / NRRL 1564) TaxID=763665 RepID=A0A2G5BA62_COERN|nr:hypothetical protein COEREDRAFT_81612 [Coemansia reversa NRRL 1564]|eukprot:PIA15880.1 hypothetical protein COEREDRAFT_81612 [Coemansia reversa NRRL 1564]